LQEQKFKILLVKLFWITYHILVLSNGVPFKTQSY